jgi:hypothetical protein
MIGGHNEPSAASANGKHRKFERVLKDTPTATRPVGLRVLLMEGEVCLTVGQ